MILTKDEMAIQISMILDKFLDVAACASEPYNRVCRDLAELMQEQRDTAHAAAIQAAAAECDRRDNLPSEIQRRILALTPAESQRSYDLRIAEAVFAEAGVWSHKWGIISDHSTSTCGDCARLASLKIAIEHLKGGPDAGEENAQAPPLAATSKSGGS